MSLTPSLTAVFTSVCRCTTKLDLETISECFMFPDLHIAFSGQLYIFYSFYACFSFFYDFIARLTFYPRVLLAALTALELNILVVPNLP